MFILEYNVVQLIIKPDNLRGKDYDIESKINSDRISVHQTNILHNELRKISRSTYC